MTEYFIRYTDNESWLRNDLQRGYSFKFYQFASSPEELLEEYLPEHLEDGDVNDLVEEFDIREHSDGSYGFAQDGLCGFGPFESVEEASEFGDARSYGSYTGYGIFEGREGGPDPDECNATLFHPIALVKVVEFEVVA